MWNIFIVFHKILTVLLKHTFSCSPFLPSILLCMALHSLATRSCLWFQNTITSRNQHFCAWLHCVSWFQSPIILFWNSFSAGHSQFFWLSLFSSSALFVSVNQLVSLSVTLFLPLSSLLHTHTHSHCSGSLRPAVESAYEFSHVFALPGSKGKLNE